MKLEEFLKQVGLKDNVAIICTEDRALEAVKQDGLALQYVVKQLAHLEETLSRSLKELL